jgi:hypothetical protein
MTTRRLGFFLALGLLAPVVFEAPFTTAFAQGTAFTYQGSLQQNGNLASGPFNLTFSLFATNTGGIPIAGPVTNSSVLVTNGLFIVSIDFGAGPFTGASNWLEIGVESGTDARFTTLVPRQNLAPAPYAIFAGGVNPAGLTNLNVTTATGTLPLGTLPVPVLTNGASSVSLGSLTATNYVYVGKWVTNNYNISTNDTLLFCWGTNETLTLPATTPIGKMFTIFSKNPAGSVIVTNGTGTQVITAPGLGQTPVVYLGPSTSPSNILTVTFDGTNY